MWDLEGRIVEANEAFLHMMGYSRDDLVSGDLRLTALTPDEWKYTHEQAMVKLRAIGSHTPFEKKYFRKDGSRVPVLLGGAILDQRGDQGISSVLDLTERKRAEAELRESERRYREAQLALAHANRVTTMGSWRHRSPMK
jgi:PAS domain S-box-containing protein